MVYLGRDGCAGGLIGVGKHGVRYSRHMCEALLAKDEAVRLRVDPAQLHLFHTAGTTLRSVPIA